MLTEDRAAADEAVAPDGVTHLAAPSGPGAAEAAVGDLTGSFVTNLRADFGAHFEANYQRLVAQLYAITLDPAAAHEAVQEAYSRAWQDWAAIRHLPDPTGWVRRVAVRSTMRSWRRLAGRVGRGRAQHRLIERAAEPRTRALLTALRRLSPPERRAVVLTHMVGTPLEEIAALERAPLVVVRARLARAERIVSEELAEVLPEILGSSSLDPESPDAGVPAGFADEEHRWSNQPN